VATQKVNAASLTSVSAPFPLFFNNSDLIQVSRPFFATSAVTTPRAVPASRNEAGAAMRARLWLSDRNVRPFRWPTLSRKF
jgi:hypothetical protein